MITAVDTSVILDVLTRDPAHGPSSLVLLERAYDEGGLVISDVVYAELAPQYANQEEQNLALSHLGISLVPSGLETAYLAGRKWSLYRKAGGSRTRLLADFLIGAHAQTHAQRLLTRDRGFFRQYFAEVVLMEG